MPSTQSSENIGTALSPLGNRRQHNCKSSFDCFFHLSILKFILNNTEVDVSGQCVTASAAVVILHPGLICFPIACLYALSLCLLTFPLFQAPWWSLKAQPSTQDMHAWSGDGSCRVSLGNFTALPQGTRFSLKWSNWLRACLQFLMAGLMCLGLFTSQ